jgi:hypothetical protein
VVHCPELPGAPGYHGRFERVRERAPRDAESLAKGGVDGIIVENLGDAPFYPGRVPAHTTAALAVIVSEVRSLAGSLPVGVNVLRNDGLSALAIAVAAGASFVRVNVLCGARVADQGILEGIAHDLLRERARLLAEDVAILADVAVKHSAPLAPIPFAQEVEDTLHRGKADALVVTGEGTGKAADLALVREAKAAAGSSPVFVGSGVTLDTVRDVLRLADGVIVGTWLKEEGAVERPVDPARTRAFMERARS